LTIRRLLALLMMAAIALATGGLRAQGVLPPGEAAPNGSLGGAQRSFPVNGAAPIAGVLTAPSQQADGSQDPCATDFQPLREEAERRGKLIKAASERHASAVEACKLIGHFGQAEIKMIRFVESHASQCRFSGEVADQLRNGHKHTENLQTKVCALARQIQQREPDGPLPVGDFPVGDLPNVF
jgi:hypothetical protein